MGEIMHFTCSHIGEFGLLTLVLKATVVEQRKKMLKQEKKTVPSNHYTSIHEFELELC